MTRPRCWSFHPITGEPLSPRGCRYGPACGFVHPDSPRWKDAPQSSHPSRHRSPPPSPSRETMSKNDRGRWNESPTRKRMPSPDNGYPARRRDDSSSPRKMSWGDPSASGSWGDASTAAWVDPPPAKTEASTSGWGDPPPSKTRGATPLSTWGQDLKSPNVTRRPSSPLSHHPLPPPPPSVPPPQPPPPSDSISARKPFESGPLSRPNALGKTRASSTKPGDTRKVYTTRVTHLSEAVLLRNEYNQVLRTLESRRRMLNSGGYARVSEISQSKLDGYAQEYEEKARDLKSRFEDALSKLVESELWPEGPSAVEPTPAHEAALPQFNDLQTRLQSLEIMIKSDASQDPPPLQPPEEKKRRRHSTSEGHIDAGTLSRLEALETRFDDVTNEVTQQAENLFQKVEARIEDKLEVFRISTAVPEDVETRNPDGAEDIREQVAILTKEYEGFVEETVDIVQKHKDLALDLKKLSEENEVLKMRNNELVSSQQVLQNDMERLNNEVQAVLSAIRITKTMPAPAPPPSAVVLEQMRAQIHAELIGELKPYLFDLREQCKLAVDSGREEILKHVGAKMGRTAEMVDIIYSFIEARR